MPSSLMDLVPIVGVDLGEDVAAGHPLGDHEGTVGDVGLGVDGPGVAVLLNGGGVHRAQGGESGQTLKVGAGGAQLDHEGLVVGGGDAQGGGIGLTVEHGVEVLHRPQHGVGVGGGGVGVGRDTEFRDQHAARRIAVQEGVLGEILGQDADVLLPAYLQDRRGFPDERYTGRDERRHPDLLVQSRWPAGSGGIQDR